MKKFKKKNYFSIITVHSGDLNQLKKTIVSIDRQSLKPDKHFIISPDKSINKISKFKKKFRFFILGKDKSIYNAMNIGLKKTKNDFIIFINSGDELHNNFVIKKIISKIKTDKCYIFKTYLKFKKNTYIPKKTFFNSGKYLPHPSFIRPPVKKKLILFDENYKILSDGLWINENISTHGSVKLNLVISSHYLGGVSSRPTLKFTIENFKLSLISGFKELIKLVLFTIIDQQNYYKIIFSYKFEKKKL